MDTLLEYIEKSITPSDETEFVVCEEFDLHLFNRLKQDGLMFSKSPPPETLTYCEFVRVSDYFIIRKVFKPLEWLNPDGSISFTNSREPIYRRLIPPPTETIDHTKIISCVIRCDSNANSRNYIEYGVRFADNFRHVSKLVNFSYGVDIVQVPQERLPTNCTFFKQDTITFSSTTLPSLIYHYAFIDADHNHESVLRDFQSIFRYLQPGGYVFLHDTYPCEESFLSPQGSFDCYKTPIAIKQLYPDIQLLNLPLNPGLCIVHKKIQPV